MTCLCQKLCGLTVKQGHYLLWLANLPGVYKILGRSFFSLVAATQLVASWSASRSFLKAVPLGTELLALQHLGDCHA